MLIRACLVDRQGTPCFQKPLKHLLDTLYAGNKGIDVFPGIVKCEAGTAGAFDA